LAQVQVARPPSDFRKPDAAKVCPDLQGGFDMRSLTFSSGIFRAACAVVVMLACACSGQSLKDPDGDENKDKARAFKSLEPTKDKLDPVNGDVEDWRFFTPEKDGKMEIRISVGKWSESTIEGFVTIFTEVGDRLLERPIPPGSAVTINATFDVEVGKRYLVRFMAARGKGEYAVEVGDPANPCEACTAKQDCLEQKCVDKPCGGGCEDGATCDRTSNRCVKVKEKPENKCESVNCGKGESCQRSTGRCIKIQSAPDNNDPPPPAGNPNIDCTVIDARESGGGAILTLSAGDNKGVSKGMTGSIKGLKGSTFTIIDVYPSRSKATCKLPPAKIIGNTSCSIKK